MKITKNLLAALLALAVLGTVSTVRAADEAKPEKKAEKAEKAAPIDPAKKGLPYSGTIAAIDKMAMTVTVKKKEAEKTFTVTADTKIRKLGKPATMDDGKVGEDIGVYYREADGKQVAISVRFGPKPEKKPEGEAKPKTEKKAEGEAAK